MCVNKFILEDSRTNIIVVEDSKNVAKILEIKNELPQLKKIVQFSGTPDPHSDVISWADLMKLGQKESDEIMVKRQKNPPREFFFCSTVFNKEVISLKGGCEKGCGGGEGAEFS